MRVLAIIVAMIVTIMASAYNLPLARDVQPEILNLLVSLGFIFFWAIFLSATKKNLPARIFSAIFWDLMIIWCVFSFLGITVFPEVVMLAPLQGLAFLIPHSMILILIFFVISLACAINSLKVSK